MRRAKARRQLRTVYCVVIEGETERWYLQLMQKHENLPKVAIKPELPKKKKFNKIKALLKELLENGYDKIFWLVDLVAIIDNSIALK